jgi:hypothetical protein
LGIPERLERIREEAKECHNQPQNVFSACDIRAAFALIEHCRSWPTMQFLMRKGLLTIENDLNIPFTWPESTE